MTDQPKDTRLWCLHHIGPDEVHPAPDFATAQKWTDWANMQFAGHADISRFVVAVWPHLAEQHAAWLIKALDEWTVPDAEPDSWMLVQDVEPEEVRQALATPARTDDAGVSSLRLALSAIKVITATVKTPDVPRALARIMAIARWAGIETPYSELQKDERVAFLVSNATREEGRAMLAALSPAPDRGESGCDFYRTTTKGSSGE